MIASRYAVKLSLLKQLLGHVDFDTRESAARLLGIATSALPTSESSALISELMTVVGGTHKSRYLICTLIRVLFVLDQTSYKSCYYSCQSYNFLLWVSHTICQV